MPAKKTASAAASALVTRYVGKCPICESDFRLTADKKMVHHGYERPGDGYIHGDCRAVGHDPYEISCEITKVYRNDMQSALAGEISYLARLQTGEIESITVLEYVSFSVGKVSKTYTKGDNMFDRAIRAEIASTESLIANIKRTIERLTKLVDAWSPKSLRTIDEFEGPKAAERAAKAAEKATAKAAKLAGKIASYQKRIDSAVAKHKAHIIAEIFDSAQRCLRNDFEFVKANALAALNRDHVFAAFGLDITQDEYHETNKGLLFTMRCTSWGDPMTWPAGL